MVEMRIDVGVGLAVGRGVSWLACSPASSVLPDRFAGAAFTGAFGMTLRELELGMQGC